MSQFGLALGKGRNSFCRAITWESGSLFCRICVLFSSQHPSLWK